MRLSFVHIVDPTLYDPGTAALAGLARALGVEVSRFPADFGSRQEDLFQALLASRPDLVAIRVSGEVREALVHVLEKLREAAPSLRLAFYGPLASGQPEEVIGMAPSAFVLTGDPEIGLAQLVEGGLEAALSDPPPGVILVHDGQLRRGPEAGPADPALAPPPAVDLFEPGLARSGVGGSFFGEPGSLTLETTIGNPAGPSGNVALSAFNHPTIYPPRLRPVVKIVEQAIMIRAQARALELADREFGFAGSHYGEVLAALESIAGDRPVSLRMLASSANTELIRDTAPGRIRRIVCELDAVGGAAESLPDAQTAAAVSEFAELARGRGFEIGLLVSAGLPGETGDDLRRKIDLVRALAPEALRFFPFSPLHGHPWHRIALEADMMPRGEEAWNREVYTPLRQPGLDEETWHTLWQDCLNLQAEVQLAAQRPAAETGR